MTKTITLIISPKGETKVETHGFSGPACRDASRFIEEALGKRASETLTQEFYSTNENTNQMEVRQ